MEEDDDDFYGGGVPQHVDGERIADTTSNDPVGASEDEEESDDDVQFTLEKPEGAIASEPPQSKRRRASQSVDFKPDPAAQGRSGTPASTHVKQEQQQRTGSSVGPTAVKGVLQHDRKEGKDFPEVRNPNGSAVDVEGTPHWPGNGKPITEVDIDADLAENSKPWRLPGTDQTDFFNYGFDEYTWTQYCLKQQTMQNSIAEGRAADAQMKAMFGGGAPGGGSGGGNGGGGMPGMPAGMPGMPSEQEMQQMMQMMGMNPEQMMQQMMAGGMPGGPGPGGMGQGGGQDRGFGSPHPQGQGFQPPTGPGGGGGDMGGFSAQQMAIMQQEQQGNFGGGGRGRGRRGRGHY